MMFGYLEIIWCVQWKERTPTDRGTEGPRSIESQRKYV